MVWNVFSLFLKKIRWVSNHPNWRNHIFQRGGEKPPTRIGRSTLDGPCSSSQKPLVYQGVFLPIPDHSPSKITVVHPFNPHSKGTNPLIQNFIHHPKITMKSHIIPLFPWKSPLAYGFPRVFYGFPRVFYGFLAALKQKQGRPAWMETTRRVKKKSPRPPRCWRIPTGGFGYLLWISNG